MERRQPDGQIIAAKGVVTEDTATIRGVHAEQGIGAHFRRCEPAAQRQRPSRRQAPCGMSTVTQRVSSRPIKNLAGLT